MTALSNYESNINKVNESAVDRIFMFFNGSILVLITIRHLAAADFYRQRFFQFIGSGDRRARQLVAGRLQLVGVRNHL